MSILTGHENWRFKQYRKYAPQSFNLLRAGNSDNADNKDIILQGESTKELTTEISNEIGTTDQAIGDVTIEEMLTTLGKIPNEMYDAENTPPDTINFSTPDQHLASSKETTVEMQSKIERTSVFLIVGITIGIFFVFLCIIISIISKLKKKSYKKLSKKEVDCCTVNRPLLSTTKLTDSNSSCCKN